MSCSLKLLLENLTGSVWCFMRFLQAMRVNKLLCANLNNFLLALPPSLGLGSSLGSKTSFMGWRNAVKVYKEIIPHFFLLFMWILKIRCILYIIAVNKTTSVTIATLYSLWSQLSECLNFIEESLASSLISACCSSKDLWFSEIVSFPSVVEWCFDLCVHSVPIYKCTYLMMCLWFCKTSYSNQKMNC